MNKIYVFVVTSSLCLISFVVNSQQYYGLQDYPAHCESPPEYNSQEVLQGLCDCFQDGTMDNLVSNNNTKEEDYTGFYFLHLASGVHNTDCMTSPAVIGLPGPLEQISEEHEQVKVKRWFDENYNSTVCTASEDTKEGQSIFTRMVEDEGYEQDESLLGPCFYKWGLLKGLVDFRLLTMTIRLVDYYPNIDFTQYKDPCDDLTIIQYLDEEINIAVQESDTATEYLLNCFKIIFTRKLDEPTSRNYLLSAQEKTFKAIQMDPEDPWSIHYFCLGLEVQHKSTRFFSPLVATNYEHFRKYLGLNTWKNPTTDENSLQRVKVLDEYGKFQKRVLFSDGSTKLEMNFFYEKLHGPAKEYYPSGQLKTEVSYYKGYPVGEVISYYENGSIAMKEYFASQHNYGVGIKIGTHLEYAENGTLKKEVKYSNDGVNYEVTTFDSVGNVMNVKSYEYGELVK